jgi:hypothetical protein
VRLLQTFDHQMSAGRVMMALRKSWSALTKSTRERSVARLVLAHFHQDGYAETCLLARR